MKLFADSTGTDVITGEVNKCMMCDGFGHVCVYVWVLSGWGLVVHAKIEMLEIGLQGWGVLSRDCGGYELWMVVWQDLDTFMEF